MPKSTKCVSRWVVTMSGRPEGNDFGGYDSIPNEPDDQDAWQEFTPWRPGDKATDRATEAPSDTVREAWQEFTTWRPGSKATDSPSVSPSSDKVREGFKWTEDQPAKFGVGDRVESTKPVGGMLGGAVRPGTIGEVTSTRTGLFDEHVTVRFDNGYTEDVSPTDIKYKGWF